MKKIYTLKKEILFTNNIYEIISMSLDKKISLDEYAIKGEFHLNGEYLVREKERDTFDIIIPYLNYIEDSYDVSNIKIDVDDFYYEIKDSNKLVVTIEIVVDNLVELERDEYDIDNNSIIDIMSIEPKKEEVKEDILDIMDDEEHVVDADIKEEIEKRDNKDSVKEEIIEKKEETTISEEKEVKYENTIDNEENNVKTKISTEEENTGFIKYKVCIVRDGDTIDSIVEKYGVSLDSIKKYNVINEINIGDKIIIPYERN